MHTSYSSSTIVIYTCHAKQVVVFYTLVVVVLNGKGKNYKGTLLASSMHHLHYIYIYI